MTSSWPTQQMGIWSGCARCRVTRSNSTTVTAIVLDPQLSGGQPSETGAHGRPTRLGIMRPVSVSWWIIKVVHMPSVSHPRTKKRPFGPNVVRAWFDTVLNYLLRGLDMERDLLQRQNWTWRFRPEGLESFLPVRQYVAPEAWPNLKQFLAFHPEAEVLIARHDQGVEKLGEACRSYHHALLAGGALQAEHRRLVECMMREEAIRQAVGPLEAKLRPEAAERLGTSGGDIGGHFGACFDEDDRMAVLAEYVVNGIGELPSYYSTSRLWGYLREGLLALRGRPDLAPYYEATVAAGAELLGAVDSLMVHLSRTRSVLSETYDVPIVAELALPA